MDLLPKLGEVIAGKYQLVRPLGKGGMGLVFEAKHLRLRQRVAIKFLKPEMRGLSDCVTRFEREGRAAARLSGPNVARIFDVDATPEGVPFMVIEYLDCRDLSAELGERGSLPIAEAVDVVLQACSAMAEAHSFGVIHRDLKPSNLYLCGHGAARVVKVLDFGISKISADDDVQATAPSITLGTPQYMSPEQIMSSNDVDLRTDIWSLGIILYKAITGKSPFVGDSSTALIVAIATQAPLPIGVDVAPVELGAAIMRALTKERAERYASVAEFAAALRPFGSGAVVSTPELAATTVPDDASRPGVDSGRLSIDVEFEKTATQLATSGDWSLPRPTPPSRWRKPGFAVAAIALVCAGLGIGSYRVLPSHSPALVAAGPSAPSVPPLAAPLAVPVPVPESVAAPPMAALADAAPVGATVQTRAAPPAANAVAPLPVSPRAPVRAKAAPAPAPAPPAPPVRHGDPLHL